MLVAASWCYAAAKPFQATGTTFENVSFVGLRKVIEVIRSREKYLHGRQRPKSVHINIRN